MLTVGDPIINVKFLKCLNKKYQKPNNLHFRKLMVYLRVFVLIRPLQLIFEDTHTN